MNKIIFRTDGGGNVGLGHLSRCLSLAESLKEKGIKCVFATKDIDSKIGGMIVSNGHLIEKLPSEISLEEDLNLTINLIKNIRPDLVITDSYEIDQSYLEQLKKLNIILMSIDDLAKLHFCSDIVLNQNIGAQNSDYSIEKYTKLLLGPEYALLRKKARDKQGLKEIKEIAKNILITLGGTDPDNQTLKIVKALKDIKNNIVVTVIMGPHYQYEELLRKEIGVSNQFFLVSDPQDICDLMEKADMAVSAGGSTCYELAYLGVPNIIMVMADNQKKIAEELDSYGISINLNWFEDVTEEYIKKAGENLIKDRNKREKMSTKGRKLVDGRGVERVVEEITKQINRVVINENRT